MIFLKRELSLTPQADKWQIGAAAISGAIGGASVGTGLGVSIAGSVVGDLTRQGILMMKDRQESFDFKSTGLAVGVGYAGGIISGIFTRNFSQSLLKSGSNFLESSQSHLSKSMFHSQIANEYATGLIQIPHMAVWHTEEAAFRKSLSQSLQSEAIKRYALGSFSGVSTEGFFAGYLESITNGFSK